MKVRQFPVLDSVEVLAKWRRWQVRLVMVLLLVLALSLGGCKAHAQSYFDGAEAKAGLSVEE